MKLFGRKRADGEAKASSLDILRDLFLRPTTTGVSVTEQTALEVSTVMACLRVLAEGIAQMPLKLYREQEDGRNVEERKHPLHRLVKRRPNEWQTSFGFRETLMYHTLLTGSGFALINRVGGKVVELLPLLPNWVSVERKEDWTVNYRIRPQPGNAAGPEYVVPRERMLHLTGPSWDSVTGLEMVKKAREAIGLEIALERSHALLHKNGVNSSGMWSVEGELKEDQYKKLLAWIKSSIAGLSNAGNPILLDRNARFNQLSMTGVDAQHLETRRFQIEEVCRFLRVFPQMVGHADKTSTYASAEQFFLAHVIHSLGPWVERWEQTLDRDLLTDQDRADGLFFKLRMQGLLRGDAKTRAFFYGSGIKDGWMTRNEARGFEEMEPLEGLDEPLRPLNMGRGSEPPPEDPSNQPAKDNQND